METFAFGYGRYYSAPSLYRHQKITLSINKSTTCKNIRFNLYCCFMNEKNISLKINISIISQRLKEVRTQLGQTLQDVSSECGVSVSTLSRLENNSKHSITVDTLERVLNWLNYQYVPVLNYRSRKIAFFCSDCGHLLSDGQLSDQVPLFEQFQQVGHEYKCKTCGSVQQIVGRVFTRTISKE